MLRQIGVWRAAVFIGARDFSPSSLEFSGLKSRAPKDLSPHTNRLYTDKEGGGWLQNGVDNAVSCEIFGTHAKKIKIA